MREKADLPADIRLYDLQHTFASILASRGQPIGLVGKLLGHSQSQTTQRYAHLFEGALKAATEEVGHFLNEIEPGNQAQ